jgi:hypothetical protein
MTFKRNDILRVIDTEVADGYFTSGQLVKVCTAGPQDVTLRDEVGSWSNYQFELAYPWIEKPYDVAYHENILDQMAPKTILGTQVGGSHYTDCKVQPIEYIWANGLGFSEGNVVKYVTRWKTKGGVKDLKKAHHHLALLIERVEAEQAETNGGV